MKMIQAIVRPEKSAEVQKKLGDNGFLPMTKIHVLGRGKQRGLKSGDVYYDGIPKDNFYIAIADEDVDKVINLISETARTGNGMPGDGKIYVYPIEKTVTISSKAVE